MLSYLELQGLLNLATDEENARARIIPYVKSIFDTPALNYSPVTGEEETEADQLTLTFITLHNKEVFTENNYNIILDLLNSKHVTPYEIQGIFMGILSYTPKQTATRNCEAIMGQLCRKDREKTRKILVFAEKLMRTYHQDPIKVTRAQEFFDEMMTSFSAIGESKTQNCTYKP